MRSLVTCGGIILDASGKVLIVRRSETDPTRPLQWDLPGGHVEPGETFEAGLLREVYEETSLDISAVKPQLVYATSYAFEELSVTWLFFVTRVQTAEVTLSPEHDVYKWVSVPEAIEAIVYDRKRQALIYAQDNGLLN